jgi:trehalose 6-phosphate synthase/phosphatase
MNLVAKEYVACHRGADGALLLSEFAGAAAEMGEAFMVNPNDEERTASAVERVLSLAVEDRQDRMAQLYRRVQRNNVFRWADRFLATLEVASRFRVAHGDRPETLPVAEAVQAFRAASNRLLLLHYDGTLVPYAARPREAIPPAHVLSLLATLAAEPGVTLAVVSGRSRSDLERWFGRIDKLWLIAEHGAAVRPPGKGWELVRGGPPAGWKAKVLPVLEHYLDRTPGSLIEEKEFALVWHHRLSDPEFGEWLANELVATLDDMLADSELQAIRGVKKVEVRLVWANKGSVVDRLEAEHRDATFRLAMGDDRTDEDLFERLRERAWTVRVGEGPSTARYSVRTPAEVCSFLDRLAASTQDDVPAPLLGIPGR